MEGGLVMGSSGNMSIRDGDRIYITRSGAMLGYLEEGDIVEVDVRERGFEKKGTSKEIRLHILLYEWRKCGAVIHTHPPYTLAISSGKNFIKPIDLEGKVLVSEIPVITLSYPYRNEELKKLKKLLTKYPFFVVSRHGLFVTGSELEEAVKLSFTVESSSKLLYLLRRK